MRYQVGVVLCAAICAALGTLVHAQEGTKIVSFWSTKWDVGSSVTYIDGNRERSDGYWGVRSITDTSSITDMSLRECGVWSVSYVRHGNVFYGEAPSNDPPNTPSSGKPSSMGLIRIQMESVDTGERLPMLGYVARHIVTTAKYDFSQSNCSVDETDHKYDGWYIDWPYSNKCSEAERGEFSPDFECGDRVIVERKGPQPSGFVISMSEEITGTDRRTVYMSNIVKSISHERLDPALFAIPSNVLPVSELKRHSEKGTELQPQQKHPSD